MKIEVSQQVRSHIENRSMDHIQLEAITAPGDCTFRLIDAGYDNDRWPWIGVLGDQISCKNISKLRLNVAD